MARLRKITGYLGGFLLAATIAYATTITWSHTFSDGEVLTASMLETMKTNITDVVNAGGGPVGLTNSQTISGDKTFSGTNIHSGSVTFSGTITASAGILGATALIFEGATANDFETSLAITDPTADRTVTLADQNFTTLGIGDAGDIIQVVNTQTGAVATGTTLMVDDDSIPEKTEGVEFMTLAITPTNTNNKLKIDVVIDISHSTTDYRAVALFQDTTTNALAAMRTSNDINGGDEGMTFSHYMTAGTTSATTFKVRAGAYGAGTTTLNGTGGNRKFGGVLASSITITEIRV